jgi:hypothetical protein
LVLAHGVVELADRGRGVHYQVGLVKALATIVIIGCGLIWLTLLIILRGGWYVCQRLRGSVRK